VVCAPCRDKLTRTGKCYICGDAMGAGGYRRCHAMERVVDSVRGPCSNAPYGCDATPAYHCRDKHLLACPHAPCYCPGEACGFAGSTAALLDHIKVAHGWPCLTEADSYRGEYTLRLGFNFLLAACPTGNVMSQQEGATTATVKCLLLLNVVQQPFGRTISVVWIDSRAAASATGGRPAMECSLLYRHSSWLRCIDHDAENELMNHHQQSTFRVASTDLSNGLPNPDGCFQFVLQNSVVADHDGDGVKIQVRLRRIVVK
jgi:E3 ubiquitin-protein ligase SIAH1